MDRQKKYYELLKRHRQMVRRMCWVAARGEHERCRDLVQEVSIALWLHFDKLNPSALPQQERAWVRWTTRTTLDHLNRSQRPPLVALTDSMTESMTDTNGSFADDDMDELMATLNPEEKCLMRMYIEGYRGDEIAASMGLKRDAVYQRMRRAVTKVRRVVVLLFLAVVASALAVVVVPQLREWVFISKEKDEAPLEDLVNPADVTTPVVDSLPDVAIEKHECRKKTTPIHLMPSLFELSDTSRPVLAAAPVVPCGCTGKKERRFVWEECDTIDDEIEPLPEVTITVNGNVIMVEGANGETVSVFDAQGRLVATDRCYRFCTLTVSSDIPSVRGSNPAPYWVQVGSRPREQVFIQSPATKTYPIIIY